MNKGYTLIEVLAALMVVSLLIAPLYMQQIEYAKWQSSQYEQMRLNLLATELLETIQSEYLANNRALSLSTMNNFNNGSNGAYGWSIQWQLIAQGYERDLYQAIVTCFNEGMADYSPTVTMTTYFMGEKP